MKTKLFVPMFLIILAAMAGGIWFGFAKDGGSVTFTPTDTSIEVGDQKENSQNNTAMSTGATALESQEDSIGAVV